MTRVDENRDVQRQQEQKRLDDVQRQKARQDSDQFGKLVSQKQENTSKATQKQARTRNEGTMQQSAAQSRMHASSALLARQGIQANGFQQELAKQGLQNNTATTTQSKARNDELRDTKHAADEQRSSVNRQADNHDKLAAISRDDRRGGQGGEGGDLGGSQGGDSGFAGTQSGSGAPMAAQGAAPAAAAQGAAGATKIPPHVLDALVKRVMVGVNPSGLSEFHIEFRENVLAGSRLRITANKGNITAHFETEDANVRRLIKASEGELARAFQAKGLRLERLEVMGT